jgi:PKD repeat protein
MGGRAQSESIGVILFTFVVVVTVGVGGAVVLGGVAQDADTAGAPLVDATIELTANEISVTHGGGDPVAQSAVTVILRGDTKTERYGLDDANLSGDDDGTFEVTERFQRDHDLVGPTVDVVVVDNASNSILAQQAFDVGTYGEGLVPSAAFGASPADPDPGESITFDASASADNDGSIVEYQWDFGDGTTTTTTSPTVDHTYSSSGSYTASLTVVDDDGATDTATATYTVTTRRAPDAPDDVVQGLTYEYYEGTYTSLPDFETESPVRTGSADTFDISLRDRDENFAFRYTGYVEVSEGGEYTFYTDSDDGSELYIGDQRVVENGGLHAATEESGTIELQPGRHAINVTFFEHTGEEVLDVRWSGPGIDGEQSIPDSRLYRNATPTADFTTDCEARTCSFDGSLSTAPSGSISSYDWSFGDGESGTGETTTHTFDSAGSYDVTLTVMTDSGETATTERTVTAVDPRPAANPDETTEGVAYTYYEAEQLDNFGEFTPSAIVRNGTHDRFDLDPDHREENYGFRYTGYVSVPETGNYTFYTTSDDGSELYIGDQLLVDNGGTHSNRTRSGELALEAGQHPITVRFFEHTINDGLVVEYEGPSVPRQEIPAGNLSRDVEETRWETTSDWDGATTSEGVVHDTAGDRVADRLQLGYPTTDAGGSNLTGYWTLDEDSGTTAVDASGSGYDGDVNGATLGDTGTLGTTAYGFDDSWVQLDDYPNLDDEITISAWIYTTDNTESGQRIFVDDASNTGGYALSLADSGNTGTVRFYSRGVDPVSLDTGNVIENNRWYHVTAVANTTSNERRIYVNGTLEASDTDDGYSGTWGTDSGAASIGGEVPGGETENRFNGRIDEVRVYNRTLSATEVGTLNRTGYNGTLTTGTRTLTYEVTPSELSLRNVSATLPADTTVNVTVLSDYNGNGTFDERADTITLDGSDSYDVTGLTNESRRFRLDIALNSTSPTATPTADRLELAG